MIYGNHNHRYTMDSYGDIQDMDEPDIPSPIEEPTQTPPRSEGFNIPEVIHQPDPTRVLNTVNLGGAWVMKVHVPRSRFSGSKNPLILVSN